jgi:acyl carrier protein
MNSINKIVIEILKKYTLNKDIWTDFNENWSIIKDLKINSARIVDIIIDIEEEYNIEISDEELDKLTCFKDITELIKVKTGNQI